MKSISFFLALMALSSLNLSFSQDVKSEQLIDEITNEKYVKYIFEGKIISSECFRQRNAIYTHHIVEVTKIVKGELAEKYVEIIADGGSIGDVTYVFSHGGEGFGSYEGMFFGMPKNIYTDAMYGGNISLALEAYCFAAYIDDPIYRPDVAVTLTGKSFKTRNEFYDFLRVREDLKVPDNIPVKLEKSRAINDPNQLSEEEKNKIILERKKTRPQKKTEIIRINGMNISQEKKDSLIEEYLKGRID